MYISRCKKGLGVHPKYPKCPRLCFPKEDNKKSRIKH